MNSPSIPDLADIGGTVGLLRAWERPQRMSVEEFLARPADELGEPVAAGTGGGNPLAFTVLSLGLGPLGTPARTDTSLIAEWKRYPILASSVNTADPPSTTLSFYSPAADGAATILEAGLLHAGATTIAGSGRLSSRVGFTYTKGAIVDVRLDYTITRSLT